MSSNESIGERLATLVAQVSVDPASFVRELGLPASITFEDVCDGTFTLDASDIVAASDILDVPIPVLTGDVPVAGHLGVSLRLGLVGDREQTPEAALSFADRVLSHMDVLDAVLGPAAREAHPPMSTHSYGKRAGRDSADRIRRSRKLGRDPVSDLVGLVESYGFPVIFQELPEGLHGMNVRDQRSGSVRRVIVISTRGTWPMQRYTLAHELCHALFDDAGQVIFDHLEEPDAMEEARAESFARELLLPSAALRNEVTTRGLGPRSMSERWLRAVPDLMLRWGISRRALVRSLIEERHAAEAALADVMNLSVRESIERAGLTEQWSMMCGSEHLPSGSPMLTERAVQAFGHGHVSVRFVAEVLDRDVESTASDLASAGWLEPVRS
ncbi:ImmA/IrrE family metallo-endopeptidase [Cellulomonas cellasea]|uniref:ImmA/IrrE family metallo-endopeptidase n=1 Tax=Cellulomonas cellasea TaxID=43670 RepID=UPI0025A31BBF|nr:ImmA/IrrE family metallo-endopeptidase [Cellulomonas cellasea]MDM8085130.1 ImmA/IrrE family metallo-endopeptidase [Cellulomonas cellasea]